MKKNIKILRLSILTLFVSSCALLQPRVDSSLSNSVAGFQYKYPQTGEWLVGSSKPGYIMIGKKPEGGSSVIATVKHGPVGLTPSELDELKKTGKIKAHSAEKIISSFKENLEADAKQGRVKNIKTKYENKKYEHGSCLIFSQTGEDNGTMPISNEGKWCFNSKTYSFVMLNMSARVPAGKNLPNLDLEKNEFFDSLVFVER